MRLRRKYTKEAILALWFVVNLAAAVTNQTLAVLNALFGALYYVCVASSGKFLGS